MADNLQRIRNQLIQGLTTILRQLNVENLENDRLDSLQFRVDWIYGLVVNIKDLALSMTEWLLVQGRPETVFIDLSFNAQAHSAKRV